LAPAALHQAPVAFGTGSTHDDDDHDDDDDDYINIDANDDTERSEIKLIQLINKKLLTSEKQLMGNRIFK
jgi:hypothetical protein